MANMQTIPVLSDNNYSVWVTYEQDFYIPTIIQIGPDMTVLSVDEGASNPGPYIR